MLSVFFFTFPLCKSLDGVFAERSWRTWEMGRASKKGQSLRFEKISCTIWLKKNTFTRIVCSFPRGDLKQVKVVVVGMPGSGAKSLASRWTTDTMQQPSNPGSVMFRHVQTCSKIQKFRIRCLRVKIFNESRPSKIPARSDLSQILNFHRFIFMKSKEPPFQAGWQSLERPFEKMQLQILALGSARGLWDEHPWKQSTHQT